MLKTDNQLKYKRNYKHNSIQFKHRHRRGASSSLYVDYKWGWPRYAIYVIQNKNVNNSEQKNIKDFSLMIYARISIKP